jgi:hypothetical protein
MFSILQCCQARFKGILDPIPLSAFSGLPNADNLPALRVVAVPAAAASYVNHDDLFIW